MSKNENKYQSELIPKIEKRFPGCIVLKNDPNYIRGIPDLTILYKKKWATLECKKDRNAKHRPGQDKYVERMNDMSFSSFIFPENIMGLFLTWWPSPCKTFNHVQHPNKYN